MTLQNITDELRVKEILELKNELNNVNQWYEDARCDDDQVLMDELRDESELLEYRINRL